MLDYLHETVDFMCVQHSLYRTQTTPFLELHFQGGVVLVPVRRPQPEFGDLLYF